MTRRDRSLLGFAAAGVLLLLFIIALLSPSSDETNPVPSIDSTGSHGARAAWDMLRSSGRAVQRWDGPLADLPAHVDRGTTVVFAGPDPADLEQARPAVQAVLARGARVLATGWSGGLLLAPESVAPCSGATCTSSAAGAPPAMRPEAVWKGREPGLQVLVRCGSSPAAVRFPSGAGEAVWWGASEPLENRWVTEGGNLTLLLNSLGPGRRILWDESLHGEPASITADIRGAPVTAAVLQLGLIGLLLLFSFGRRSGPLRADPEIRRQEQDEFFRALGSLYRRAGAADEAVATAYGAFRRAAEQNMGAALPETGSPFPALGGATEEHRTPAGSGRKQSAGDALARVQDLHDYQAALRAQSGARERTKEQFAEHPD